MPQSNIIFASLLFAFLVYIISKGEGPTYLALLSGGGNAASASAASASEDALNIDVNTNSANPATGGGLSGGEASSILGQLNLNSSGASTVGTGGL